MKETEEQLDDYGELYSEEILPPDRSPRRGKDSFWRPKLGPMGYEILADPTENILLHGERGSLKTGIAMAKLVLAMYENNNNLGIIYTIFRGAATEGGIWEKLLAYVLPEWADGIGLEFSDPKMDDQKNRHVFISNMHGQWVRIVLKSLPPGVNIQGRMRGQEPGFILFDEIGEADNPSCFHKLRQQLRRPNIPNPQWIGTTNPPDAGEEHWLYPLFFSDVLKDETGKLARKFHEYHVPLSENIYWTDQQKSDYQDTVRLEARGDPTVDDRLNKGLWVPIPSGKALFRESFDFNLHVIGNYKDGIGLRPRPGYPILLSYDPGSVNTSVTFEQLYISPAGRLMWIVFDEVDHLGERILYKDVAQELIKRMKYWREREKSDFHFIHITDESAINQFRPNSKGRYDAWEFEEEYTLAAKEIGFKTDPAMEDINPKANRVKFIGCPKGDGSIEARVHMVRTGLSMGDLLVSAMCRNSIAMLNQLPEDPKELGKPKPKHRLGHKFDSFTYAPYYFRIKGHRNLRTGQVAPSLIRCGSG